VDEVLAEWAAEEGVGVTPAAEAPAAEAPTEVRETPAAIETPAPAAPVVEEIVAEGEAAEQPAIAAAASAIPRWLSVVFIVVPLLAVLYLLAVPNGPDCGSSGQLALDPVTGIAIGCEGSPYGVTEINYFTLGEETYRVQCASCHGSGGGGGSGPAFTGGAVLATFPAGTCTEHRAWIDLGTNAWPDGTYGATAQPVGGVGVMPGFGGKLTPEEIAAASLYERVAFGGEALDQALADCTADLGDAAAAGG
jgi:mono/diheme cytochrome c family protein